LTKIETVLIFAGIPAFVIAVVYGLVFASEGRRGGGKRYRPGRPFQFQPVWFLSAPDRVAGAEAAPHKALPVGRERAAVLAGGSEAAGEWPGNPAQQSATGGASDRW
jgi:hypothetical protein